MAEISTQPTVRPTKMIDMMKKIKSLFGLSILCLASCTYLLTPNVEKKVDALKKGQYKLDTSHTTVLFKIQHLQLSTFVGRFNEMDASLNFDPENISSINLQALVKTASIDVNNSELEESLREGTWLNSDKFPEARLETLSVTPSETSNQFIFNAQLTLLGVTKPIQLEAIFHGGAYNLLTGYYTLGFSANGTIKRSDFGMDEYIPLVGDTVALEIYAEFLRMPP